MSASLSRACRTGSQSNSWRRRENASREKELSRRVLVTHGRWFRTLIRPFSRGLWTRQQNTPLLAPECSSRLGAHGRVVIFADLTPDGAAPVRHARGRKHQAECSGSEVRRRTGRSGGLSGGLVEAVLDAVEVGGGELPLEWGGDLLVAAAEREEVALERVEVGEVVGRENLALDDREVDLGLVEPAGVDRGVDGDQVWPAALEAVDRALSAVR